MKRTLNVPKRSAYDISRPLYDALQKSCDQIEKQSEQFRVLRDQVQCIHVAQQPHEFDSVVQSALDSCLLTLQSHISIFEAVVATVKPEPGKEALQDHAQFVSLVSVLKGTAKGYEKCKQSTNKHNGASTSKSTTSSSEPSSSDNDFHEAPEVQETPTANQREPEQMTIRKKRKLQHDNKPLSSPEPPTNPKPSANKAKKKKPATIPKEDTIPKASETNDGVPEAADTKKSESQRRPSFEDISGEVEARLAAKAEKRKAKKESKKRKRESIASSIFSPEPEKDVAEVGKGKVALPPKKRIRTLKVEGDGEEVTGEEVKGAGVSGRNARGMGEADGLAKRAREAVDGMKKSNTSKRRRSAAEEVAAPVQKESGGGLRKRRRVGS